MMSLPVTWGTQKAAVLAAAQSAGAVSFEVKSTFMKLHFPSAPARTSFKAAVSGIAKIVVQDTDHAGKICETVTPTA
jgi:hypothetical protein